jgi:hypothetical protein
VSFTGFMLSTWVYIVPARGPGKRCCAYQSGSRCVKKHAHYGEHQLPKSVRALRRLREETSPHPKD